MQKSYPTESIGPIKVANVNNLVLCIIGVILYNFKRKGRGKGKAGQEMRNGRKEEIVVTD